MIRKHKEFWVPAVLILVACTPVSPSIKQMSPEISSTPMQTKTVEPTPIQPSSPVATATDIPVNTPTPYQFFQPTPAVEPIDAAAVAGFIFNSEGLKQIGPDGKLVTLYSQPVEMLSPDVRQALIQVDGKYWLVNLADGGIVRLTMNPDRVECCAQWWTKHEDRIILISHSSGQNVSGTESGYVSVIKTNGTGFRVLDTEHQTDGMPAISPDGTWIAYGSGGVGWLFGGELGPQQIDPQQFGLNNQAGQKLASPSWSADGTKLAWRYLVNTNGTVTESILILDLANKTHQIVQAYPIDAKQLPGERVLWSPDGKWLSFQILSTDANLSGTWIKPLSTPDGTHLRLTDATLKPGAWSPDGAKLILTSCGEKAVPGIFLSDAFSWKIAPLAIDLPSIPVSLGWK